MKSIALLGIALATSLLAAPASAGYVVSATMTSKLDTDGVDFDYTIILTNSTASTLNVGTFWFAWVPGKDFMTSAPLSEITPTGWGKTVTHGGVSDGYAIRWIASTAAFDLTPGNSLTFGFTSAETPAQLAGLSPLFPTFPTGTSFVYSGRPFSDAGDQFVVQSISSVPEPSSLVLTLFGAFALIARKLFTGRPVAVVSVSSREPLG